MAWYDILGSVKLSFFLPLFSSRRVRSAHFPVLSTSCSVYERQTPLKALQSAREAWNSAINPAHPI